MRRHFKSIAFFPVATLMMSCATNITNDTQPPPKCLGAAAIPDARSAIRRAGADEVASIRANIPLNAQAYALRDLGREELWQRTWTATLKLRSDRSGASEWDIAKAVGLADDPGLQGGIWRVEMFPRGVNSGPVAFIARCSGIALPTAIAN